MHVLIKNQLSFKLRNVHALHTEHAAGADDGWMETRALMQMKLKCIRSNTWSRIISIVHFQKQQISVKPVVGYN